MGKPEDTPVDAMGLTRPRTLPAENLPTCQAIVQSLPQAVILLGGDLNVAFANEAASALFRIPAAEMHGRPIAELVPYDNLSQLLGDPSGTMLLETPLSLRTRWGAARTVRITAVSLAGCHVLAFEDISDRVLFEQQLVESEKQAILGMLACSILRDIASPIQDLGSTLKVARSALGTLQTEELAEVVDLSLQRVDHARQLLGTQPRLPVRMAPSYALADLHEVLHQCLASIAHELQRRGIDVVRSFAPPAAICEVDVRLIRIVMLNLLRNAVEAMPDGGRLEVRTHRRGDGASSASVILIQVIDSGVGIAEADLRRVFRPLFSTKPGAAGLGLSFCRQAVEEHGGQIRLTSRGPSLGTIATVSLPLRTSAATGE